MDKLQLKGQRLGQVFNFRSVHLHAKHLWCYRVKLPDLKLKTRSIQLLGSLRLDITLPALIKLIFLLFSQIKSSFQT
jgi:hypothetical protein